MSIQSRPQQWKRLAMAVLSALLILTVVLAALPQAAQASPERTPPPPSGGNNNGGTNRKNNPSNQNKNKNAEGPSRSNANKAYKDAKNNDWTNPEGTSLTALGSNNKNSTLKLYISGGRLLIYATNWSRTVTLMVKMRDKSGVWQAIKKVSVKESANNTLSADIPSALRTINPLEVCLKSMFTNEQICYSVVNKQ